MCLQDAERNFVIVVVALLPPDCIGWWWATDTAEVKARIARSAL
jgi:hypothetical protein